MAIINENKKFLCDKNFLFQSLFCLYIRFAKTYNLNKIKTEDHRREKVHPK
jgi:hypothetical protein